MSGVVTDKQSRTPIEGATISVVGGKANQESTDAEGSFILSFAEGIREGEAVRIRVEKPGYRPYDKLVAVNSTIVLQVSLLAQSQPAIGKKQQSETKPQETKGEESKKESPKIESPLTTKKQPPPLIKRDAFSTLIPFVTEESAGMIAGARVPYDSNDEDPLHLTYSEIAGISSISLMPEWQSGVAKAPTLTDADMSNFLGRVLQYYILRSISEMQHTITSMGYETGRGTTTVTTSAVIVPDETEYPRNDLDKLLAKVKIPVWQGGLWVWKSYPLKVPKGTIVSFSEESEGEKILCSVRFMRTPDFRLDFKIEPAGRNQGQGTFPKYFVPSGPKAIKDAYTYIFVISLNFQWNGDHTDGEPYVEWADGLFSGLRKKLVIPNPSSPRQAGPINTGPCSNVQVGGNNNTATTNCIPPSRVRSPQQLTDFTAVLGKSNGMLRVVMASSADDVFPLSRQLCEAANSVHWGIACPNARSSIMGKEAIADGLECYPENWESADGIAFKEAMKAAQLPCKYISRAYSFGPGLTIGGNGGVTILIGSPSRN